MASASSFKLIQSQTLGSDTSTVSFTSIPSTYTDLMLLINARVTRANSLSTIVLKFNSNSSNYYTYYLNGDGTLVGTPGSASVGNDIRNFQVPGTSTAAQYQSNTRMYIANYSASNRTKAIILDNQCNTNNNDYKWTDFNSYLWNDNATINRIDINEPNGGSNVASGSTFSLYGIVKF